MQESMMPIIDGHVIGDGYPCFIIAEVAQAHDGSLGTAHAYIDALADTGIDAIKFQTHMPDYESTLDESFRVKFSLQDKNRYEYWKRMEFKKEQWLALAEHAKEKNLIFLSSPFSIKAVNLLNEIGVPAWKVGSGELYSNELLDAMAPTGKPILISTGMSSYKEIGEVVSKMRLLKLPFALLQCTSSYPTDLKDVGLNIINELRERYICPVGLSDHSGNINVALAALFSGANLIEIHVVFDRRLFGPDVQSSLTIEEIKLLVKAKKDFQIMKENPVDKDSISIGLKNIKSLFTKSLAPSRNLTAGTIIEDDMLIMKKPGTGISYLDKDKLIGKRLIKDVDPKRLLTWEDISEY